MRLRGCMRLHAPLSEVGIYLNRYMWNTDREIERERWKDKQRERLLFGLMARSPTRINDVGTYIRFAGQQCFVAITLRANKPFWCPCSKARIITAHRNRECESEYTFLQTIELMHSEFALIFFFFWIILCNIVMQSLLFFLHFYGNNYNERCVKLSE